MKALYATLLVIAPTFAAIPVSKAEDIPLVVGQFSFNAQGNAGICLNPVTSALESCGSRGVKILSAMGIDLGAVTWDNEGHSCVSYTNVQTALPIGASHPSVTSNFHLVTKLIDYDSKSGTGDNTFTTYVGGKCIGANFDGIGATIFSTGAEHFVVGDGGNRLDFVLTTLTNSTGSIGGFSFAGTELKQPRQHPNVR